MSEENVAVVRDMYAAFGRGDVPAVLGAMSEDIEWHEAEGMPYGGLKRGPQQVAEEIFAPAVRDIADFLVTGEEYYAAGDEVVAIARYTGKGAESGKPLDLQVAHAFTIRDGKVTRFRQFADAAVWNDVLAVEATA